MIRLPIFHKFLTQLSVRKKKKLKFINIDCQSLNKRRDTLIGLVDDLRDSKMYGIRETWLGKLDEAKLWEWNYNFKFFRGGWKSDIERGGNVMLTVPNSLNPRDCEDLN